MDWISSLLLATVRLAIPVLLISLAELYGQRAGMVNIGLEGLASIGALVGFLVCYVTGSNWLGLLCGAAAVDLGGRLCHRLNLARHNSSSVRRCQLLIGAITLHNIPEGMAVGVAFGALAGGGGMAALSGACMLALGIGLQNFPEGAAVSLPLRREGMSRGHAFFFGQLSGFVEPLSAVLGALLAATLRQALPFLLCFAAGAMLWVILTEMVPESQASSARVPAAWWTILGFCLMTILDVALG